MTVFICHLAVCRRVDYVRRRSGGAVCGLLVCVLCEVPGRGEKKQTKKKQAAAGRDASKKNTIYSAGTLWDCIIKNWRLSPTGPRRCSRLWCMSEHARWYLACTLLQGLSLIGNIQVFTVFFVQFRRNFFPLSEFVLLQKCLNVNKTHAVYTNIERTTLCQN